MSGSAIKYRTDIDGLRAIAVLSVILYHFEFSVFKGGYIGVDVFFVISGYLIGQGVIEGIRTSTFSFADFAERRIRRLYPALIVALAVSLIVGWLLLLPVDLRALGESVIATVAYVSNFHFYREAGYFDAGAINKPLLHTWSLAVEEQFYILLPITAWLLSKARLKARAFYVALGLLAVASFVASVAVVSSDQPAAFFLFPFRLWEMALGVAAAYLPAKYIPARRGTGSIVALAGLAGIMVPVLAYSHDTLFPGLAALPPCLGTALLIAAGQRSNHVLIPLLTLRPVVLVGLLSYSLYLWHWPIVVCLNYWYLEDVALTHKMAGVLLTFVCAYVSWRWVEKPLRNRRFLTQKTLFKSAAATSLALAVVGAVLWRRDGVPERYDVAERQLATAAGDFLQKGGTCDQGPLDLQPGLQVCRLGRQDLAPSVLIWGDSHGRALRDGLHQLALDKGQAALFIWQGGCPPLIGVRKQESASTPAQDQACLDATRRLVEWLGRNRSLKRVLLIGRWPYYTEGTGTGADVHNEIRIAPERGDGSGPASVFAAALTRTALTLAGQGREVFVLRPIPEIPNFSARAVAQNVLTGRSSLKDELEKRAFVSKAVVDARQSNANAAIDRLEAEGVVRSLDLRPAYCTKAICSAWVDGKLAYFDNNHLTVASSIDQRQRFAPLFD